MSDVSFANLGTQPVSITILKVKVSYIKIDNAFEQHFVKLSIQFMN